MLLLERTIRFPCRPTGIIPSCARPWPFECSKPFTGMRDIRNCLRIPLEINSTFWLFSPSSS